MLIVYPIREAPMKFTDRWDEDWQEWRCSDCDPDLADDDEPEGEAHKHEKPYVVLIPLGEPKPDHCPRCSSYLSLCEGDAKLRVTNTPAERYTARQAREAEAENA
jgi:hypothetical protein